MKITLCVPANVYKKNNNIRNAKKFQVLVYNYLHFFITSKLNKNILVKKMLFFIKIGT